MSQRSAVFGLVASLLVLALLKNASGIQMTVTPASPQESVDITVQFSCNLGPNYSQYRNVFVMDVVKNSKTQIAIVRPGGNLEFKHSDIKQRFQGSGFIPRDAANAHQAYLNLTLLLPRVEDSASYSCVTSYENIDGLVKQDKDVVTVTVKKGKTSPGDDYIITAVRLLVQRVEKLEKSHSALQKVVEAVQKQKGR